MSYRLSVIGYLFSVVGIVSCCEAVLLLFFFSIFNVLFLFTANPSPDRADILATQWRDKGESRFPDSINSELRV